MASLITVKRAHPDDGLLAKLIAARDDNDKLSEDELVSLAVLLLIAGHETTTSLIGNAVLALLQHPEQLAALRLVGSSSGNRCDPRSPRTVSATVPEQQRFRCVCSRDQLQTG